MLRGANVISKKKKKIKKHKAFLCPCLYFTYSFMVARTIKNSLPEHSPVTRINKLNNCNNNLPASFFILAFFWFFFGCQIQRQNFFFAIRFWYFSKRTQNAMISNKQQQQQKKNQKNNLGIHKQQQQINQLSLLI